MRPHDGRVPGEGEPASRPRGRRLDRPGEGERVGDRYAAPAEGSDVLARGGAVDLDGGLDGGRRDLQRTGLVGRTDDEEVGIRRVAEQRLRGRERVERVDVPARRSEPLEQCVGLWETTLVSWTMSPVGVLLVDATATVRSGLPYDRLRSVAAVSRSKASTQSADPGLSRFAGSDGPPLKRRCPVTGPAFWLRPVWSSDRTSRPAMTAAVDSTWLTVRMPVPPIPAMKTFDALCGAAGSGSGQAGASGVPTAGRVAASGTCTVMKEGQSP